MQLLELLSTQSLLYADDAVLLVTLGQDLQRALGRLTVECEAARMRVGSSKPEAMGLNQK